MLSHLWKCKAHHDSKVPKRYEQLSALVKAMDTDCRSSSSSGSLEAGHDGQVDEEGPMDQTTAVSSSESADVPVSDGEVEMVVGVLSVSVEPSGCRCWGQRVFV